MNCSHTERLVGSIIDCAHLCLRENGQCRSINTEKAGNNAKQGGFKCQLNNSTKEHHAQRFKKNPSFNYYEPKKVHIFFVFYLSTTAILKSKILVLKNAYLRLRNIL